MMHDWTIVVQYRDLQEVQEFFFANYLSIPVQISIL